MKDVNNSNQPMVNGEVLIGFLDCVKGRPGGKALYEKFLSALPPESEKVCRGKIIAVANYPYSVFGDCIRTVDKVLGDGSMTECRNFGKYRASVVIQAFLKIFKDKIELEEFFRLADMIWKNNHINSGYIKIEDSSPEHSLVRIYDFPGMDPAHCRYMEGFLTQAMVEAGVTWIEEIHEVKCAAKGDEYHEFVGRWKA